MTNLETDLRFLKSNLIEMMEFVKIQLEKAQEAMMNMDLELAEEIVQQERRLNAMELSIDRDCENIIALSQPVATDLRLVVSVLKINSDLERIGDYAENIATYLIDLEKPFNKKHMNELKINEMFEIGINMLGSAIDSFDEEDPKIARKLFKKDKELNKINANSSKIIAELIKKDTGIIRPLLFLFSIIRKLERVGDHNKNIAENIIFYTDAKVLKHRKKLK